MDAGFNLKDYLDEFQENVMAKLSHVHGRIDAQVDMTDKIILPKLNNIEDQARKTNSRVTKLEIETEKQVAKCKFVQEGKTDFKSNKKFNITTLIALGALIAAILSIFI